MRKSTIDKIKNILLQQKEELEKETSKKGLDLENHDNSIIADANDRATRDTDMSNDYTVKQIKSMKYLDIIDTLRRIEKNDFGICEDCGCDISEKRLKAYPTSKLCIVCQEELEKDKKNKNMVLNSSKN
jgi:DnaK suppressor protein